jgi:hypothetical protein
MVAKSEGIRRNSNRRLALSVHCAGADETAQVLCNLSPMQRVPRRAGWFQDPPGAFQFSKVGDHAARNYAESLAAGAVIGGGLPVLFLVAVGIALLGARLGH